MEEQFNNADIHQKISILREILPHLPEPRMQITLMMQLSLLLVTRSTQISPSPPRQDLQEAVTWARRTLEVKEAAGDDFEDCWCRANLGRCLFFLYDNTKNRDELEEAITAGLAAVDCFNGNGVGGGPEIATRSTALCCLSAAMGRRAKVKHSAEDLRQAIAWSEQALRLPNPSNRVEVLSRHGNLLTTRYEHTNNVEDLEEGVKYQRLAVEETSPNDPKGQMVVSELCQALRRLFIQTRSTSTFDEMMRLSREVYEIARDSVAGQAWANTQSNDVAQAWGNLANAFRESYEQANALPDVEKALDCYQEAVKSGNVAEELLCNFGDCAHKRYAQTEGVQHRGETIEILRTVVDGIPNSRPQQKAFACALSAMLNDQFDASQDSRDLDDALKYAQQAVDIPRDSEMPERHASSLLSLSETLYRIYGIKGEIELLTKSIALSEEAEHLYPAEHAKRPDLLQHLGLLFRSRALITGQRADMDEAFRFTTEALERSDDEEDRLVRQSHLGLAFLERFNMFGDVNDLIQAGKTTRETLSETPEDWPLHRALQNNLASMLETRYLALSDTSSMDEAISISKELLENPAENSVRGSMAHYNLGTLYASRFRRDRKRADVDKAIECFQTAGQQMPDIAPAHLRFRAPMELSVSLTDRFTLTDRPSQSRNRLDLENAISISRSGLESCPPSFVPRPYWKYNMSIALHHLYNVTKSGELLDEAIDIAREILKEDHQKNTLESLRGAFLVNLAENLRIRSRAEDRREAHRVFLDALRLPSAKSINRLTAGKQLLHDALDADGGFETGAEALEVAQITVNLIPLSISTFLPPQDKKALLREGATIARDAAAVALHFGYSAATAVDLLETGRGVLLDSLRSLRMDITDLKDQHKSLAERFEVLRAQVDSSSRKHSMSSSRDMTGEQHEANLELAKLIDEIRLKTGFDRFMRGPSEAELRDAASEGPIVIVNISKHRCDALINEKGKEMRHVKLPTSLDDVVTEAGRAKNTMTLKNLEWLWNNIVDPVLVALDYSSASQRRLWWVPTGPSCALPLHAAGYHRERQNRTAIDRVISSYSSSIRAIIVQRQRGQQAAVVADKVIQVAAVAAPNTRVPSLGSVDGEIEEVERVCTAAKWPIARPERRDDVLSAVDHSGIFHFAGHGAAEADPLQSCIIIEGKHGEANWNLTVNRILETNAKRQQPPFLAYLSACCTSQNRDDSSLDESIHMASAFQLAGFQNVISTLWEVDDELCGKLATKVYEFLTTQRPLDASSASSALHFAVCYLREVWNAKLDMLQEEKKKKKKNPRGDGFIPLSIPLWVPYIHYGV